MRIIGKAALLVLLLAALTLIMALAAERVSLAGGGFIDPDGSAGGGFMDPDGYADGGFLDPDGYANASPDLIVLALGPDIDPNG